MNFQCGSLPESRFSVLTRRIATSGDANGYHHEFGFPFVIIPEVKSMWAPLTETFADSGNEIGVLL